MDNKLFIILLLAALSSSIGVYGTNPVSCEGQWYNCDRAFTDSGEDDTDRVAYITAEKTYNNSGIWYNYCFSIPNAAVISDVLVRADFLASNSQVFIDVRVSGDGGLTYGTSHIVGGNVMEEQSFIIDVTNDLAWTPDKLNNSNFRVNVTCFQSPANLINPLCYLEWLEVGVVFNSSLCVNPECTPRDINIGALCNPCSNMKQSCNVSCQWKSWYCDDVTPSNYSQACNCGPCGCGGTIQCDSTCSGPNPAPLNYGQACGNCGSVNCSGGCTQGICAPGSTQCLGTTFQTCIAACTWQNSSTDADGDGVAFQCGDSLCDNMFGVGDSTKTVNEVGLCNDGIDNNCNGVLDCNDTSCVGDPNCPDLCNVASDCVQSNCTIEACVSNKCQYTNRTLCDAAECPAGSYCTAPGGTCRTPDQNQSVCLNCVPDQTSGYPWTWVPSNHQDGGKAYSTNTSVYNTLFNSDGAACSAASGGPCYNASNNPVVHKSRLTTGNCCGNNPNEFYKPDYYGGECTNNVNDCVWSSGDAQASNTGNAKWWCYLHEWNNCIDSTIGTKISNISNVSCVGVIGNNAWTPNFLIKPENQYSCTDGKDNDANGLIDCDDPACKPVIIGIAANQQNQRVPNVDVSLRTGLTIVKSAITGQLGNYSIIQINCGTYNLIASHADYLPNSRTITLSSGQQATIDLAMILGTSCEPDCTYFGDNIVHASCDAKNGCTFYDSISRAACDNSQPGWIRDYSATQYVVCASGAPQPKVEIKASVSCESGTLIKVTRIVLYNGKPVKLVVAACS